MKKFQFSMPIMWANICLIYVEFNLNAFNMLNKLNKCLIYRKENPYSILLM